MKAFSSPAHTHRKHTVFHLVLQGNSQKRGQGRGLFFGLLVPRVSPPESRFRLVLEKRTSNEGDEFRNMVLEKCISVARQE